MGFELIDTSTVKEKPKKRKIVA